MNRYQELAMEDEDELLRMQARRMLSLQTTKAFACHYLTRSALVGIYGHE